MGAYATVHPTARPWEAESFKTEGGHGKYDAYRLVDANGKTICDTMNGELQTEHVEYDDLGSHAWDEQGRVDMEFAAKAINAHDDLVAALSLVEWAGVTDREGGGIEPSCACCDAPKANGKHFDGCQLATALAKAGA